MIRGAAALVLLSASSLDLARDVHRFQAAPGTARAQRIGALEETIGGPHAISGQIGDWLLRERSDPLRRRRSKGVGRVNTTYGGSLVDADLVRVERGQRTARQRHLAWPAPMATTSSPSCCPGSRSP